MLVKTSLSNIKIILLLTAVFLINGCSKENVTYDLTGNWRVLSFDDYVTATKIIKTPDITWLSSNNGDITIGFIETTSGKGDIKGIRVTNRFEGNYTLGGKGEIQIADIISTHINEPSWTNLFYQLKYAESYEIRNNLLTIFYNNKKNGITFERY